MTAISPDSVLAKYLNHKTIKKVNHYSQMIFPFGFNISQKEATEKALNNQISIIEGPPETGKTQTILNIIANAIIKNKTVAIVSNNNLATLIVFEKLKEYDVERDEMKNGIFEKYNILILRVATNGSGEEEKLKNKLEIILNIKIR